jgi:hypothetical protein
VERGGENTMQILSLLRSFAAGQRRRPAALFCAAGASLSLDTIALIRYNAEYSEFPLISLFILIRKIRGGIPK